MKKLIGVLVAMLFSGLCVGTTAFAQCSGQFDANKFCGNTGVSKGLPGPVSITAGSLPTLGAGNVLGNATASPAAPQDATLTSIIDRAIGSTRGSILERNAVSWGIIAPGTAGLPFVSGGAGADPSYAILGMSGGGTSAALTASNGGLVYSTGSALAILPGTATANQIPLSGSNAAPSWSTATYPATTTANQILYSSTTNAVTGLATANGGVLNTNGSGVPSITPTPTLGVNSGAGGQITLNGSTSGSAAIRVPAVAGTGTIFQLPPSNGSSAQVLQTDGSGNTSWVNAAGGGTVTSVGWTGGIVSVGTPTTTPAFTVAGTSGGIPYFSSTSSWASSALLTANALIIGGGAGNAPATTATGTGIVSMLGNNIGTAGAPVAFNGALGTPSSGTLSNTTGLPISTGVSGLGTGIATALAVNTGSAGAPAILIAKGTSAMGTSAISSATCATVVTTSATGVATTDTVNASFNGDPTAATGYVPLTTGMLTIIAYPTANNVNFKVCNNTSASITPGAITLNWNVVR